MNGTIEFSPNGRGTWRGRTWNGEQWADFKRVFFSKGDAERFAASRNYRALFIES